MKYFIISNYYYSILLELIDLQIRYYISTLFINIWILCSIYNSIKKTEF